MDVFWKMLIKMILGQRKQLLLPLLLIGCVNTVLPLFYHILKPLTLNRAILILSGHLLLSSAIWSLYSFTFLFKKKPKLHIYRNYKYDDSYNFYCPSCETMLQKIPTKKEGSARVSIATYRCFKCKEDVMLAKDDGFPINRDEFIKYIKNHT